MKLLNKIEVGLEAAAKGQETTLDQNSLDSQVPATAEVVLKN